MTQQRNIHVWHLLTLALAFVAGGALTLHLPRFQTSAQTEANRLSSEPAQNAQAELQQNPKPEVAVQPSSLNTTEASASTGVAALTPDDIPLFLQNELDDLRFEAERAREEIEELREQLDAIDPANANLTNAANSAEGTQVPADVFSQRQLQRQTPNVLNRNALIQAGVAPDLIDGIQQRQDQQSLARLELFDRAAREGYSNTERLSDELEELEEASPSLREELGDDAYDQFLHNAGRPNRVAVASVITGSAADISGMQIGDIIFSYASDRVFTQQELQTATRDGVRDEPIVIEIVRDQLVRRQVDGLA